MFHFPSRQRVDRQRLRLRQHGVDDLWNTYARVRSNAFGTLTMDNEADQKAIESLGNAVVPDLVSGKFQRAFADESCGAVGFVFNQRNRAGHRPHVAGAHALSKG